MCAVQKVDLRKTLLLLNCRGINLFKGLSFFPYRKSRIDVMELVLVTLFQKVLPPGEYWYCDGPELASGRVIRLQETREENIAG